MKLTKAQLYFLDRAIELRGAVLALDPECSTEEEFKKDTGFTKKKMNSEIESLRKQLFPK